MNPTADIDINNFADKYEEVVDKINEIVEVVNGSTKE